MFTAALFIKASINVWKQLTSPPTDEWMIKSGVHIQWNIIQLLKRIIISWGMLITGKATFG